MHDEKRIPWLAAGAWAAVVAAVLWVPGPEEPPAWGWLAVLEQAGGDKVTHFLLFAVQAWLLCRVRTGVPAASWLSVCLALTVAYGALTEAIQAVLGARSAELADLAADAAGAAAAVAAFAWWRRR